ncbi:MAG: hypothetical protein LBR11_11730 [Deltaproteobacteria bacterium]|nr:hypothetical protein [Deltaproteobacteria bacterium]
MASSQAPGLTLTRPWPVNPSSPLAAGHSWNYSLQAQGDKPDQLGREARRWGPR